MTNKSRVEKLHKMGMTNSQIHEVTNISKSCIKSYIYQYKNKAKVDVYNKEYFQKHKTAKKLYDKKYREANREYVLERQRNYWHEVYKCKMAGVNP